MRTINISLTRDQFEAIERLNRRLGFANRSEFFRAILRFILKKPEIITEATAFPFVSPDTRNRTKIIEGFKKTGKYSPGFLKDLEEGLKESSYFAK